MAAVTLKDLMDPLTKLVDISKNTNDKVDDLIKVVSGGQNVAISLQQAILTELQLQTQLLKNSSKGGGLSSLFSAGGAKGSSLGESANALKLLGAGTMEMAKALIVFSLVPKRIVSKFNLFVSNLFKTLTEYKGDEVQKGVVALGLMGDSILNFSKALALSAVLLIPGMIAIPFLILSIGTVGLAMAGLGMFDKQIIKGAEALDKIGNGIKSFAIGLALFGLTTLFIMMAPKILLGMVTSIILIGGAVALLGVVDKQAKKGAGALALIGLGLIVFSVGYAIFALATKDIEWEDIGKQAAIIGGIGLVTALLGAGLSFIAQGALALALTGLSLIPFGIGYAMFAASTKGMSYEDVGIQMAVLTGIGLVTTLVGVAVAVTAGAALLGPLLYAAAGASLLLLAPGLAAMKALNFGKEDANSLSYTLGAVAMAFSGSDPEAGFFENVGNVFGRVVESGGMAVAAAGYAAAGTALILLSKGLTKYKELKWTDEDTIKLTHALTGISVAFASAAGDDEPVDGGGFIGTVFGVKRTRVEEGIRSVMDAGDALTGIAKGLQSFQNLINSGVKFGDPKDPENDYGGKDTLAYAVINTVGFVQQAFAAVAEEGNVDGGGFFGSLFNIKRNKVEEGIRSVMDAGDALNGIAKGLSGFQELIKQNVQFGDPSNPQPGTLAYAVINTLGFVRQAFAAVADEGNVEAGGFFSTLFGTKKNKVEEGIISVKGAGEELSGIANGLKIFSDMVANQVDFDNLGLVISKTLGIVRGAFAMVGGETQDTELGLGLFSISWSQNKVEEGIEAVEDAGETLKNIAEGLLAFSKIGDPTKVAESVKSLLESMSGTFSSFYDKPEFSSRVDNFSEFIETLAEVGEDGSLMDAADGFQKIADAINSVDPEKASIFRDLFQATSDMGSNSRTEAALEALVDAIEEIKDTLSGESSGIGAQIGGAFDGLKGALGFGGTEEKGAPETPPNLGATLARIQSTLSKMDTTLASLPGEIAAIEIRLPKE